jgi:hypothetical protein
MSTLPACSVRCARGFEHLLEKGGRFAPRGAKREGISTCCARLSPLPKPPPFKGRELKSVCRTKDAVPRCVLGTRLPARRADLGETPANTQQKLIADLTIGGELLLAAAIGRGRVVGRPIFHISRKRAREL